MSLAASWLVLDAMPVLADQVRAQEWWLSKLSVTRAWHASRGSGVIVAVLSDGVAAAQSDLVGSVTAGPDFTQSGPTARGPDFGGQGTAIASLIAGHGHGAGGIAGVTGVAPAARVLSVRVTLGSGDPLSADPAITAGLPSAVARGIRYAVRHGATVIDLPMDPGQVAAPASPPAPASTAAPASPPAPPSTAAPASPPAPASTAAPATPPAPPSTAAPATPPAPASEATAATDGSAAEQAAVGFALRHGVVLVAPAGDAGVGTDAVNYPAAYPGVIAVGAFGRNFATAAFSSRPRHVALTAPGAGVVAATPSGTYTTVDSTSAASAIVSGITALIQSEFPSLTAAQLTGTLIHSTVFHPRRAQLRGSRFGTVNAARALAAAARIGAPMTRRAGVQALPRRDPPAVAPATASLAPRLLRDAVIAAGVLIVLLMLISAYWASQRRGQRRGALTAALWQSRAAERHAGRRASPPADASGSRADRLPDMLAAQPAEPGGYASSGGLAAGRVLPGSGLYPGPGLPGSSGYGDYAGRAGSAEPASFGRSGSPAGHGSESSAAPDSPGSRPDAAPGPLAWTIGRPPQVSGAPPWGPAPPPDSELSWAATPAPPPAARRAPAAARQPRASDPPWPVAAAPPSADDELTVDGWDHEGHADTQDEGKAVPDDGD
ncbi:MAG TPA: S8 family serine peptidase [Streptosporangiaceae bacterium]|nr:S8 family serine peptidase [Streptosporangiaceae bacterium]